MDIYGGTGGASARAGLRIWGCCATSTVVRQLRAALGSPDTTEVYAGVSYGPATLKYSYALSQIFGVPDSEGSDYLELAVNQPVMTSSP